MPPHPHSLNHASLISSPSLLTPHAFLASHTSSPPPLTPHSAASVANPPVSFTSSFYFFLFLNFGFDWLEKCNRKQKWILRRKTKNVTKRKWKRKRKRIWFTGIFFCFYLLDLIAEFLWVIFLYYCLNLNHALSWFLFWNFGFFFSVFHLNLFGGFDCVVVHWICCGFEGFQFFSCGLDLRFENEC